MAKRTTTLARIMSNQPFPMAPRLYATSLNGDDDRMIQGFLKKTVIPEIEQWVRGVEQYLKDIWGKLTANNIVTTINQGGGAFIKTIHKGFHFDDDATYTATIDSSIDWRTANGIAIIRATDVADDIQTSTDETTSGVSPLKVFHGAVMSGDYPKVIAQAADHNAAMDTYLRVTSTGELEIFIDPDPPGIPIEGYIEIFVAVTHLTKPESDSSFYVPVP